MSIEVRISVGKYNGFAKFVVNLYIIFETGIVLIFEKKTIDKKTA